MTSKILIAPNYGHADVLKFHVQELPSLAEGMARIQVKSAGINPIDARRMVGEFRHGPLPQTFGTEFAGIIVDIMPNAKWKIGDEVLGSGGAFTHATVIDVPLTNLIARPQNVDWAIAGTLAGVAQTAMTILDEIGPVSSLLVQGASGGVGSITVQLARERHIEVVATASAKNQEYLKNLGAIAVTYGPGLTDRLREVHPALFDASIDMSGTEEATQAALSRVKPEGIIGTIAGKSVSSERVKPIWVKRNPTNLAAVVEGIASGKYKWTLAGTYPFDKAADAYTAILDGHTTGKIALLF